MALKSLEGPGKVFKGPWGQNHCHNKIFFAFFTFIPSGMYSGGEHSNLARGGSSDVEYISLKGGCFP